MRIPRRLVMALAASLSLVTLAGYGLGRPPLLPEEAGVVAASGIGGELWRWALRAGPAHGISPETLIRLPSLLLSGVATFLLTFFAPAGRRGALALLGALHPGVQVAARTAGISGLLLLAGAGATILLRQDGRWLRAAGALLVAGSLLPVLLGTGLAPLPEPALGIAAALWGLFLGEGLPPWRVDIAVPALVAILPLAWLGAGRTPASRSLALGMLLLAAAAIGACASRPLAASLGVIPLVPLLLDCAARGAERIPSGLPRAGAIGLTVTAGLVGGGDLHLGRDVVDPARRVAWDEAARMTALLAGDGAAVLGIPALPAPLSLYAPGGRLPVVATGAADRELGGVTRLLVVSSGERGGLSWPSAALEETLERRGLVLRGELTFGQLEPGLQALLPWFTRSPAPAAYLRVRRYER